MADYRAPLQRNVADLTPGDCATVRVVSGRGAIRQRLLDMGILPRARLEVRRVAPSGNPIWISVEGLQLSLRLDEARCLLVTETPFLP